MKLKKNSKRKYFRYDKGIVYKIPRMRFIQIWVNSDDYVLTYECHRGGVRW